MESRPTQCIFELRVCTIADSRRQVVIAPLLPCRQWDHSYKARSQCPLDRLDKPGAVEY